MCKQHFTVVVSQGGASFCGVQVLQDEVEGHVYSSFTDLLVL